MTGNVDGLGVNVEMQIQLQSQEQRNAWEGDVGVVSRMGKEAQHSNLCVPHGEGEKKAE